MNNSSKLSVSFEFFPPKTPEGKITLEKSASELSRKTPDFFSVTFGAGGSTREGTIETVTKLQHLEIDIAPHLACVGLTRHEIITVLNTYQSLGIKRIVAIRGDLPSGMGHSGELRFADELVTLIRDITTNNFYIEVAAYPEIHPQASNTFHDLLHLRKK